jgi:hypothetical protein
MQASCSAALGFALNVIDYKTFFSFSPYDPALVAPVGRRSGRFFRPGGASGKVPGNWRDKIEL